MTIRDWSSDVCSSDLGFSTLAEILALKPDTKVIVASGHGARESALRAIAEGAWDFYQKPIDIDALGLSVAPAFTVHDSEAENRRRHERGRAAGGLGERKCRVEGQEGGGGVDVVGARSV